MTTKNVIGWAIVGILFLGYVGLICWAVGLKIFLITTLISVVAVSLAYLAFTLIQDEN